ncbi:MAG TPA: ATP-binding cassette domain-containing protein [Acidimicrobiales bacterium]|nr:ATP-binding cassette domain-containing protein [Acidimicrobiales bacterium]
MARRARDRAARDPRATALLAAAALAFSLLVGVVYPAPLPIVFLGLVVGSLSGLVAVGLVLVYRANRIINFAQGSVGGLAGVFAASLIVGPKWPYLLAVAVALVAALALGGLTELVFVRRFARAPRLILTVATIGVAQLYDAATIALPKLFNYDSVPQPPQPFPFHFSWFPVVFNGGHLLIVAVVPVATAALFLFLRRSRAGVAIRAAAESSDRAASLGIPVKRLNTLVWILAGGLSGLGVLLRLPIQGVAIGAALGPSLLLFALAAAAIGRFESLPRTLVASLAIGVLEQAVFFRTGNTDVVNGVLLVVIIVALVANRPAEVDRAAERDASSWAAVGLVRAVPATLRRLPEFRAARLAGGVGLGAFLLIAPLAWSPSQVSLFSVGLIYALVVCSLVVLTGWAGQISLGQMAFAAIGGAVAGTLALHGKNFFLALALATAVGAVIALLLGIPALRMQGPFLAVTTLAFALATGSYFLNPAYFSWLVPNPATDIPRPVLFRKFDLSSEHTMYYVVLLALVLGLAVAWRVRTSRVGRTLIAVRDNARAAQSYGVSPARAKLTAFAVGGGMAALAGALYAYEQQRLVTSLLDPETSITVFVVAVIGGLASLPGAMLGAAYLTFVNYSSFTHATLSRLFASALGVLVILLFLPGGLGGPLYALRDRLLRALARRRQLVVPNLLADVATSPDTPPAAGTEYPVGADPVLVVTGLDVSYGRTQVLFEVDLHVERGEVLALLGTNGAGKSTILGAVSGLIASDHGRVMLDGSDITGFTPQQALAAGVVLVPGGKAVFPTLTVAEHLRLAAWTQERTDPGHVAEATEGALATFPILRARIDQRAGNLSGGEQQMLALAQALIARPKLLLIDELSLGLAPVVVEQLLEIVKSIRAGGTSVVLVEQSLNTAASLADRAVFLEKGTVRFVGPTADLLDRGDVARAVFFGAAATRARARTGGTGKVRPPFLAACPSCGHEHPVALEARELSVRFGGITAVDGVSFSVRQGEILGLIGANGAGKTTVLDLVSGFLTPSAGRVILAGQDVTALPADMRAIRGLGRSFQDARLFATLTVREAIATAFERHVPVPDALAAVVLSPAVKDSEREINARVDGLIEAMGLHAFSDKFVGELSTGTRRIVDLACVLAHDPSVLLLDEPSSGIAQREAEALGPVLLDIRDRTGAALVVIEHDIPLVRSISDRLMALEVGTVIAEGPPDEVLSDARVIEGYLGSAGRPARRTRGRGPAKPGAAGAAPRRRKPAASAR